MPLPAASVEEPRVNAGLVLLQVAIAVGVIVGVGLMVTVTSVDPPVQPPLVSGVTVNTTIAAVVLLGLFRVTGIGFTVPVTGTPLTAPEVTPAQEKLVAESEASGIVKGTPLHWLKPVLLVKTGPGSTFTVTILLAPKQELAVDVGDTEYKTVPTVVLLELINASVSVVAPPGALP